MRPVSRYLEHRLSDFLYEGVGSEDLFLAPMGEPGLVPIDGITAEVYRHPLVLFIGGITAVLLELAEPRVRHGVWDHSIFPSDPVLRLRRTGLATMVTVYAAQSVAQGMIDQINDKHRHVAGVTPEGQPYRADDPELLTWVQATAAYGFIGSYDRYFAALNGTQWSQALQEAAPVARAYGVPEPPASKDALMKLLDAVRPRLGRSDILSEFLRLMRDSPALPGPGRRLQPLFIRAAIDLLPLDIRTQLGLEGEGLGPGEGFLVKALVQASRLVRLRNHPYALAQGRLNPRENPSR